MNNIHKYIILGFRVETRYIMTQSHNNYMSGDKTHA